MTTTVQSGRDGLGDRIKAYEASTKTSIEPRSWTAIRLDGKAFHTWTKGLERPYSIPMIEAMADSIIKLTKEMSSAVCFYQQSDELTVILQDFAKPDTQAWYGGQVQKQASVAASMMTAFFGQHFPDREPAFFDARVFSLPNRIESANCLLWRQLDAKRNAISMIAGSMYSPKELHGKSTNERLEMIKAKGWKEEDADARFLYGQFAYTEIQEKTSYVDKRTGETIQLPKPALSRVWKVEAAPTLDAQPDGILLSKILPEDPK